MLLLTLNNDRGLRIGMDIRWALLEETLYVTAFPRHSMFSLTEQRSASRFCFLPHPLNANMGTSIHVPCKLTSGKKKRRIDMLH
jgi:hypothetical protein